MKEIRFADPSHVEMARQLEIRPGGEIFLDILGLGPQFGIGPVVPITDNLDLGIIPSVRLTNPMWGVWGGSHEKTEYETPNNPNLGDRYLDTVVEEGQFAKHPLEIGINVR